jgi:uroporphyrin-III C-methyltransferase/precorrin-2 dehydrogenase/sirohydrochlorin ferrochelatase
MNVFPLFFNLTGKTVVVVGGGTIAERKVRLLLRAGARVTVVAPEQTSWLRASAQAGALSSLFTSFVAEHIREAWPTIATAHASLANQQACPLPKLHQNPRGPSEPHP